MAYKDVHTLRRGEFTEIGAATKDFTTKQPDGNFRFKVIAGTIAGQTFKTSLQQLRNAARIKVMEDQFVDAADGNKVKPYLTFVGYIENAAEVESIKAVDEALKNVAW